MNRFDVVARVLDRPEVAAMHARLYRLLGGKLVGKSILLLTTTGRKSGRRRTTPLFYVRDGGAFAIVASNGGDDPYPGWWHNIRTCPDVEIQVGHRHIPCTAEIADANDVPRLWARLDDVYTGYARYRERTERELTIIRLLPRAEAVPPLAPPVGDFSDQRKGGQALRRRGREGTPGATDSPPDEMASRGGGLDARSWDWPMPKALRSEPD